MSGRVRSSLSIDRLWSNDQKYSIDFVMISSMLHFFFSSLYFHFQYINISKFDSSSIRKSYPAIFIYENCSFLHKNLIESSSNNIKFKKTSKCRNIRFPLYSAQCRNTWWVRFLCSRCVCHPSFWLWGKAIRTKYTSLNRIVSSCITFKYIFIIHASNKNTLIFNYEFILND